MFLCIVLNVTESLLYVFGNSLLFIIAGQVLKGLCGGFMMSGRIQYLYHIAPEGLAATTNTLISSIISVVSIVFMSFSGFILEVTGVRVFFLMIACAEAFSMLLLLITRHIDEKNKSA